MDEMCGLFFSALNDLWQIITCDECFWEALHV